jgi:Ca2+-binding EF-hand superfamily protein
MKKTLITIALTIFTGNIMTACGSNADFALTEITQVDQTQQIVASSFSSIKKEIEKATTASFNEMDKNSDKMITPAEYEVKTPEQAQAFYALDDNHDGKVTLKEMLPNFFSSVGLTIRLQKTADALFKILDRSKDHYLSPEELDSGIIAPAFITEFKNYDVEKQWMFFNKGTKDKLSKSEFENMFAHIAINTVKNAPAPAPDQPPSPPQAN